MSKKNWIMFAVMMAIFVAVLALDLVTKYVFDAKLDVGETITVIPKVINFSIATTSRKRISGGHPCM